MIEMGLIEENEAHVAFDHVMLKKKVCLCVKKCSEDHVKFDLIKELLSETIYPPRIFFLFHLGNY